MFKYSGTAAHVLCRCCVPGMSQIHLNDGEQPRSLDREIEMQSGGLKGEDCSKVNFYGMRRNLSQNISRSQDSNI